MAKSHEKYTAADDDLLAQLGVESEVKKTPTYTKREQRIIAGFEEIQRFVEEHGRLPRHGEERDIFERRYAVRLDRIRAQKECVDLLRDLDPQRLLTADSTAELNLPDDLDDAGLLTQLGVVPDDAADSITNLRHVKSQSEQRAERQAAEAIAHRTPCEDFEQFEPLFAALQRELDGGLRETVLFRRESGFTKTDFTPGKFVIVGGQMALLAERGDPIKAPNGDEDARLRMIYANGTESNILLRSLIRAMYKDETSRFVTEPDLGPLFSGQREDGDLDSGTIYVLRSQSDHPMVAQNRQVIHKIGVTGGDVNRRIANATNDATFLLAGVDVVVTYQLANINRTKLEGVLHKFFDGARLDIEIKDRFGKPVRVREWFLVPVSAIDAAVERIREGTIGEYVYRAAEARVVRRGGEELRPAVDGSLSK